MSNIVLDYTSMLDVKSPPVAHLLKKRLKSGKVYVYVRESIWDGENQTSRARYLDYLGREDLPGYKRKLAAAVKKYDLKLRRGKRK